MPKRSNDFQRLIKRIYDQLAPFGAVVTESALLPEVGGSETREIDVLVEIPMAGAERPLRMAIECRDHARRGDKTWIDALVGKYRDLPVDRIIAVSRNGFTAGAQRKVRKCNNMETRTLAEALDNEWPDDLFRVDIGEVSHWPEIGKVSVVADPPWLVGESVVSVQIDAFTLVPTEFALWLSQQMFRAFGSEAERQRKLGNLKFETPGTHPFSMMTDPQHNIEMRSADGVDHHVSHITLTGSVTVKQRPLAVKRYRFGSVGVTRAPTLVDGGANEVIAVQETGKPISIEIVQNRKK